jgi:transketolase
MTEQVATDKSAADQEKLSINTIRTLSIDAVQKANSGHPGTPMGMAPVVYTLWQNTLRYDPRKPAWPNRDRFVLSVGHASMLLYSVLHLAQVEALDEWEKPIGRKTVTLDDIKNFRQLGSRCPGHPESHLTTGVECTTGPLGQGVAMSVGMAIAERALASLYNQPGHDLIDYNIYALCGDGCMMEGISAEAASLAGHLRLSNLCWIYDSNQISIEGSTEIAFTEDVGARFLGYGWNVLRVRDANNTAALKDALEDFKRETARPTMIIVESKIGYGSPHKQGTREAHGEPLGVEEVKLTKRFYGWPEDAQFLVPDGVYDDFAHGVGKRGAAASSAWEAEFAVYKQAFPALAAQFEAMEARHLPEGWQAALIEFPADAKGLATRDSSGKVLNALAQRIPYLLGGAADLSPSTKTDLKGLPSFEPGHYDGRNFHFGVREHAMGAVVNGMVFGKLKAYGSGFFIFSDYMRAALRMSAIQEIPSIWVFTHDSIGVGEDGPTHQPIEHLASLRAMPNMHVIRPADANDVSEADLPGAEPAGPADARSVQVRRRLRPVARRLCAVGSGGWCGAESAADRHRQRGAALPRRSGEARRRGYPGPGDFLPELGSVRGSGRGLSRERDARSDQRPRRGGAGRGAGLGPLYRPPWQDHRHA